MKNKYLKIIIYIFTIFLFSYAFSFLICNFGIIRNVQNNKRKTVNYNVEKLVLNNLSLDEDIVLINEGSTNPYFILNYDETFINKLSFNYSASFDFSWTMEIEQENIYGNMVIQTRRGASSYKTNLFSENIKANVKSIKITFDGPINNFYNFNINNNITFNKYIFIFTFLTLAGLFILIYWRKYFSENIDKAFLIIVFISGLLLIYLVPKFTFVSWDDETHFTRAYQIFQIDNVKWTDSANQMRSPFPYNVERINTKEEYESANYYFNVNNNYSNIIAQEEKSTNFIEYLRWAYIPSALAITVAKVFNAPFTILFCMGKLSNLIVYAAIMYFAIKIIPIGKKLLTFFALLPSTVWLATQYSCDSLITSCIALFISIFLYEMVNKTKKISTFYSLIGILSILFASFAKGIYIPLILILLLLPKEKFYGKKEMIIFKIGIIGLFLLVTSTFVLPAVFYPSTTGDTRAENTSVLGQGTVIKNNILAYSKVLYDNAGVQFFDKFFSKTTLSSFSYMGEINNMSIPYIIMILLLFFTFTDQSRKKVLNTKLKIFLLIIILGIICLIWTSLYISYTAVESTEIQGVQWRYFIPLLFPLLLCIQNNKIINKIDNIIYTQILYISSFLILMTCIYLNIVKIILF